MSQAQDNNKLSKSLLDSTVNICYIPMSYVALVGKGDEVW